MRWRKAIRSATVRAGFEISRVDRGAAGETVYSDLQDRVARYITALRIEDRHCVDIAAADGKQGSNTYALFQAGWKGLAVEAGASMFGRLGLNYAAVPDVQLFRGFVTPLNVVALLRACTIPPEFGFLSLDIDSYDRDVLASLLSAFQPQLMCVEINERIPPPLRFHVEFSPNFSSKPGAIFGQSLSTANDLAEQHGYVLVDVWYNNALFAVEGRGIARVDIVSAYKSGYRDRPDRTQRFPWNAPFEPLHSMDSEASLAFLENHEEFVDRRDQYQLSDKSGNAQ